MRDIETNVIVGKSMAFAIRCVKLKKYLNTEHKEYDISKQLFRSGTSIGANIKEGLRGYSKADFSAKFGISLKEASESEFWIDLLYEGEYITKEQYESLKTDCVELIKLLTSIVKSSKE